MSLATPAAARGHRNRRQLSAQHSAQPVKRLQETVRVLVIERQWRPDLEHVADASGRNQYLPFAEVIDHTSGKADVRLQRPAIGDEIDPGKLACPPDLGDVR